MFRYSATSLDLPARISVKRREDGYIEWVCYGSRRGDLEEPISVNDPHPGDHLKIGVCRGDVAQIEAPHQDNGKRIISEKSPLFLDIGRLQEIRLSGFNHMELAPGTGSVCIPNPSSVENPD